MNVGPRFWFVFATTILLFSQCTQAPSAKAHHDSRSTIVYLRVCDSLVPGLVFQGQYAFTPTGQPVVVRVFDEWCPTVIWVNLT